MFNENWMVGFFMGCGAMLFFFWGSAMLKIAQYRSFNTKRVRRY